MSAVRKITVVSVILAMFFGVFFTLTVESQMIVEDVADASFGINSSLKLNSDSGYKENKGVNIPIVHCGFPNGTFSRLHFFNCDPMLPLQVTSIKLMNSKSNTAMYPLRLGIPLVLDLELLNNGSVIQADKFSITLSEFGSSGSSVCSFNELPSFGAFDNLDGCDLAQDCPIPQGRSSARIPLYLDQFFEVIHQLKHNKVYQLVITVLDTTQGLPKPTTVGCFTLQGRVL